MSCEEAFSDAVSQFEAQEDPRDVAGENARLREQLRSMESKLEEQPDEKDTKAKISDAASSGTDNAEEVKPKRRGRPRKEKLPADFDLPTE